MESVGWAGQGGLHTEAGMELGLLDPPEPTPPARTTEGPGTQALYRSNKTMFEVVVKCSQVFEKRLKSN